MTQKNSKPHPAATILADLERLRVERDWSYRELTGLVGLRSQQTTYAAIRRGRCGKRTLHKITRFLDVQTSVPGGPRG